MSNTNYIGDVRVVESISDATNYIGDVIFFDMDEACDNYIGDVNVVENISDSSDYIGDVRAVESLLDATNYIGNVRSESKVNYDADAVIYINKSFIGNPIHQNAINDFVVKCKKALLWDKIKAAYWLQSDNETLHYKGAIRFNLKGDATGATDLIFNGTSAPAKGGFQFVKTSGNQANTGYIFPSDSRADRHICHFGTMSGTSQGLVGDVLTSGAVSGLFFDTSTNTITYYLNDLNNLTVIHDLKDKIIVLSRKSTSKISLYSQGVAVVNEANSNYVNVDTNSQMYLGKANTSVANTLGYYYSFGYGLTADEAALYSTYINELKLAWDSAVFDDVIKNMYLQITPALQSGTPIHIESVRGNYVMASKAGKLLWSTDSGDTYSEISFTDSQLIVMSHIFENGNVLFATTKNELWQGKNGLTTLAQKALKNADNSTFVFHTPVNPAYPGTYFNRLFVDQPAYLNGNEMLIWGTYQTFASTLQTLGASPIIVFYSADQGETVKVAYKFGQNTVRTDTGAQWPTTGGNLLGDATNPVLCDHVHCVYFDKYANCFYVLCGETPRYWIKLTYNSVNDTWANEVLVGQTEFAQANSDMYRCSGLYITADKFRILSDSYGNVPLMGIYECLKSDIKDVTKFTKIYVGDTTLAPSIIFEDKFLAGHINDNQGYTLSKNGGVTVYKEKCIPMFYSAASITFINRICYPNKYGFAASMLNLITQTPYAQPSYFFKF